MNTLIIKDPRNKNLLPECTALAESTLKFEFGRQRNPTRSASAERHKSINKRSRVLNATLC